MLDMDLRYSKLLKQILLLFNNSRTETNKIVYNTLFDRIKWSINIIMFDKSISKKNKLTKINEYFSYVRNNIKKFNSNVVLTKKDKLFMFFVKTNFVRMFYLSNRFLSFLRKYIKSLN